MEENKFDCIAVPGQPIAVSLENWEKRPKISKEEWEQRMQTIRENAKNITVSLTDEKAYQKTKKTR